VFAPGESPFRAKGNVYRGVLESADERVPGGRSAVFARLDDPKLQEFFRQTFLAASTYDILPLVAFGEAGAQLTGVTHAEFVRVGAAFTARRDMRGIYKVLLKLASPSAVVQRLPRVLSQYFDFGKIEGRITDERTYEGKTYGIPRPLVSWIMNVTHGFVPVVMASAGARDVTIEIGLVEVEREQQGVDLMKGSFVVRWK
jgi:hypothetical protein